VKFEQVQRNIEVRFEEIELRDPTNDQSYMARKVEGHPGETVEGTRVIKPGVSLPSTQTFSLSYGPGTRLDEFELHLGGISMDGRSIGYPVLFFKRKRDLILEVVGD
jgi:hypothetical protein